MRVAEDPGPPPEVGLVVRAHVGPDGEGFYARVSPRPRPPWGRWLLTMAGYLALGTGLSWFAATSSTMQAWMIASVVLFGGLLTAFSHGIGYFPVEITADDRVINFGGERFLLADVASCEFDADRLWLVAADGRVLAELRNAVPAAARWVALAVRASLPMQDRLT